MAETNLGFQMFLPLLGQAMVGVPMGYLRQQVEALWEARDAANLIWEAEGEPDEKGGRYRKSPKLAQADAEAKKREREFWQAVKSSTEFAEGTPRWLRQLAWAWLLCELLEYPAEIIQTESEALPGGRILWRATCRVWECQEHQYQATSEAVSTGEEEGGMGPFLEACARAFLQAMAEATGFGELRL